MLDMRGPGRFTAGVVVTSQGGALLVVEKHPRKVSAMSARAGEGGDEYEDVLTAVWAERFTGSMTEKLDAIAKRLASAPLADDCDGYVDVTTMGLPLRRLLIDRGAYALPLVVSGEDEKRDAATGVTTVPLRVLQTRVTLAFEGRRLNVLAELGEGPTLLRALENLEALPISGPTRDLAYAAAIAVWAAHRHATLGPWASRKLPAVGTPEHAMLAELALERRIEAAAQQDEEWWDAV